MSSAQKGRNHIWVSCKRVGTPIWGGRPPSPIAQRMWFCTTKTSRSIHQAPLQIGDHLVFGKETKGLPDSILEQYPEQLITLPMMSGERSLNLATAVCAAVYVGIDQLLRRGELHCDAQGRLVIPAIQ